MTKKYAVLLLLSAAVGMGSQVARAESTLTLNLNDVEISTVISTVSEMTGYNFIVDPRVKGKVTVISSTPMSADEIYQVLLSILSVHGFAAIPGDNVIKIVPEVNAKQDAIETVDEREPGRGDESVTRVIQVENVSAAQLVPILRPLLPQEGHLAAHQASNVLIAAGAAANIERLARLVRRIDQSSDAEIELIPLQHASAEELVRIVTSLEQSKPKGKEGSGNELKVVADTRSNSILLSGDKSERLRLRVIIAHLDTPLEREGATRVIYLHYAKAKDLVSVLNGVSNSVVEETKEAEKATKANVSIQADETTNALVINAPPSVMRDLESVIRQLDVRRAQVLVEAIIAEVSGDKVDEFGVVWGADGSSGSAIGVINYSNITSGLLSNPPRIGDGAFLGFGAGGSDRNPFSFIALLRALKGQSDANILSTPSLVTMDNEEAEIVVGQTVPFITGSYTSTGTGSTPTNPFQTVQRQDVGLTLKLTPQINEGDAIKLDIDQESSSVIPSAAGIGFNSTQKRSLKTSVMVNDGQILVLGGLIDDQLNESQQKVPLLGDLPLLGGLFRYQRVEKTKRNLMIFIHPAILREGKEELAFVSEKYNYIRAEQIGTRERGVRMMENEASPLLPELEELLTLPPPYLVEGDGDRAVISDQEAVISDQEDEQFEPDEF